MTLILIPHYTIINASELNTDCKVVFNRLLAYKAYDIVSVIDIPK